MYSRENPSPRYLELEKMYQQMHNEGYARKTPEGDAQVEAEQAFPGDQLPNYALAIAQLMKEVGAKSVLDYGAGKGEQYKPLQLKNPQGELLANSIPELWGTDDITLYDPGVEAHNTLPDQPKDMLVTTDVLEHIPAEDIPWILDEMFSYASKGLFLNVACYPAIATLPDGSNAHVTIEHPKWWEGMALATAAKHNNRPFLLCCVVDKRQPDGTVQRGPVLYPHFIPKKEAQAA